MTKRPLRLVVADDDADYRLLVGLAVAREPELTVIGEAGGMAELVGVAASTAPDVILIDASMPGALASLSAVRAAAPDARVVLTSSLPAGQVAGTVAAAGAVGSLAKDVPVRHLAAAIIELGALVTTAERALRTARTALPQAAESVRASRQLARRALDGWCDVDVQASVELLISELTTNGIRHADSDIDVRISIGANHVRVEVADRSEIAPTVLNAGSDDASGRGMRIVDELASRWGVQRRRTGKCVWFELPRVQTVAGA